MKKEEFQILWEHVEVLRNEFKRNQHYLQQVGRYYSLYQNERYKQWHHLLDEMLEFAERSVKDEPTTSSDV